MREQHLIVTSQYSVGLPQVQSLPLADRWAGSPQDCGEKDTGGVSAASLAILQTLCGLSVPDASTRAEDSLPLDFQLSAAD